MIQRTESNFNGLFASALSLRVIAFRIRFSLARFAAESESETVLIGFFEGFITILYSKRSRAQSGSTPKNRHSLQSLSGDLIERSDIADWQAYVAALKQE
jgi:hypothetical protein